MGAMGLAVEAVGQRVATATRIVGAVAMVALAWPAHPASAACRHPTATALEVVRVAVRRLWRLALALAVVVGLVMSWDRPWVV